jgi:chemotaxis-related protein WspD
MEALAKDGVTAPAIDDCWNRIGVRGDRSCMELTEHIHCRNCRVFAGAARALLDRPVPADYIAAWSSHFAEAKTANTPGTGSAVIFRLGSEWFALATRLFDEITEPRPVHSLPHQRNPSVLGLVNIRGELTICVSIARLLGLSESSDGGPGPAEAAPGDATPVGFARARLVVIRHGSGPIAFPVDEVQPTFRFDEGSLKSVPATIARASSNYTIGLLPWRDHQIGYLDAERIVHAVNRSLA